ncbi:MAG: BrnA antitoxin family protein [Gemmatimonadota bacterium]
MIAAHWNAEFFQHVGAIDMSAKRTKPSSKPAESPRRGRANLAKLRVVRDREIARTSPPELADLPADFWAEAELVLPVAKQAISLRVDEDVLSWFRNLGPRYQTRMNAVLRSYMSQASRSRSSVRRSRSGGA